MVTPVIDARAASAAYQRAFAQLATFSGFSPKVVLRAECGSFLKAWAYETQVANAAQADRNSRLHAVRNLGYTGRGQSGTGPGEITVNAGYKPAPFGQVWIRKGTTGKRKDWLLAKGPKFSAPTGSATFPGKKIRLKGKSAGWAADIADAEFSVVAAINRALPKGRGAIGLARQSVLQIADTMNIDLTGVAGGRISAAAIAKAKTARAVNGRSYQNGTGTLVSSDVKGYADMLNRLPYNTSKKLRMDLAAMRILNQRANGIETAWKKGTFDSQRKIAAQFPNLVRVNAA